MKQIALFLAMAITVMTHAQDLPIKQTAATMSKEAYEQSIMFPVGEPNPAQGTHFVGQSYVAPLNSAGLAISNVTFEPGCHNDWHAHNSTSGGGHIFICVGGRGYYQEWGKDPIEIKPGHVQYIPPGVKHWQGASPNSWFSHVAFEIPGTDLGNEWFEPVTPADYNILP